MYTLDNFYQSKQWQKLLISIKAERLNDKGQTVCEYCGKPITLAYDCIGHHKDELTEENVNDVYISLNPDNVMLVHHKCHNIIHNKLGYKNRGIWLVYGSPLSGKSTYTNNVKSEGDLIVDMDSIWEGISGCKRYVKPNRLKGVAFAIRNELLDAIKYRRGMWNNAYIIGGYPLQSERERLCKELGAKEIYIESTLEECMNRLMTLDKDDSRATQIKEWTAYIEEWYRLYTPPIS